MLAVLHALNIEDIHFENIIRRDESPYLFDLETSMLPSINNEDDLAGDAYFKNTILRTGVLPRWIVGAFGEAFDVSALGYERNLTRQEMVPIWVDEEWDHVTLSYQSHVQGGEWEKEKEARINLCVEHGFREMYKALLSVKEKVCSELAKIHGSSLLNRIVLRPTRGYAYLLRQATAPKNLESETDFLVQLMWLFHDGTYASGQPNFGDEIFDEIRQLYELDIPYFSAEIADTKNGWTSGINALTAQIDRFSDEDLRLQEFVLNSALVACTAHAGAPDSRDDILIGHSVDVDLAQEAVDIANEVLKNSIVHKNGQIDWLSLEFLYPSERYQLNPMGDSLYSGRVGVGIFFAAMNKAGLDGAGDFKDASYASIKYIRRRSVTPGFSKRLVRDIGVGAAFGVSSIIYGLTTVGKILDDKAVIDDAIKLADSITIEVLAATPSSDVTSGVAGALLTYLSLYGVTAEESFLVKARHCAIILSRRRVETDTGMKAWDSPLGSQPLIGFAHGVSGISYALLKISKYEECSEFEAMALEGMEYERRIIKKNSGIIPDFRVGPRSEMVRRNPADCSWCTGVAGILLARECVDVCDPNLAVAFDPAGGALASSDLDHLCCGLAGHLEVFAKSGQRESERSSAYSLAGELVRRKRVRGYYRSNSTPNGAKNFGLFTGLSGIGYTLLRVQDADGLPSVIRWE